MKIISRAKGVPYVSPDGSKESPHSKNIPATNLKTETSVKTDIKLIKTSPRGNKKANFKDNVVMNIKPLNEKEANVRAEEMKNDNFNNCEVNSPKVIEILSGFV